jgi:hypothetical protein
MAKSQERIKARKLRAQGLGIKTIARKLSVSSSTVSLWCRDIVLSQKQIKELERRMKDPYYGERLSYVRKQKDRRIQQTKLLLRQGIKEVGRMTKRERFLTGIGLYWAEGFKKDNLMGFANSDPEMVRFFLSWIKLIGVTRDRVKLRVGINELYKNCVREIELFWSEYLQIPRTQFQKPFFQRVAWKKQYDHPEEYHGVVRIRITRSTDLLRKMIGWIEGLKKNIH